MSPSSMRLVGLLGLELVGGINPITLVDLVAPIVLTNRTSSSPSNLMCDYLAGGGGGGARGGGGGAGGLLTRSVRINAR